MNAVPKVGLCVGFSPIVGGRPRVLVLGSLPGRKSLEMGQYYAQPQNGFWRIMGAIFGAGPSLPYPERLERLVANRVAVWDVLAAGERNGSLDSAIVASNIVVKRLPLILRAPWRRRFDLLQRNKAAGALSPPRSLTGYRAEIRFFTCASASVYESRERVGAVRQQARGLVGRARRCDEGRDMASAATVRLIETPGFSRQRAIGCSKGSRAQRQIIAVAHLLTITDHPFREPVYLACCNGGAAS